MDRPAISAEIRRAVLVESGHRCAIPQCRHPDVDLHHIVPWETCKKHEYENLIALCPNCHRRAHKGEIDRVSLRTYKAKLVKEFANTDAESFSGNVIEIKHCIEEANFLKPGFRFSFEYPDFKQPDERIVSRNIEAWGNELLAELITEQKAYMPDENNPDPPPNWLRGKYLINRRDTHIVSVQYNVERYLSGGAHRFTETRVQNFGLSPFTPLTLNELLREEAALEELARMARCKLLDQVYPKLEQSDVELGTKPSFENFSLFLIGEYGMEFIFEEYSVASYALGRQKVWFDFHEIQPLVKPYLYTQISNHDGL